MTSIMADAFQKTASQIWEAEITDQTAFEIAIAHGFPHELHRIVGGATVIEFMDGSFALVSNRGDCVMTTWLEQDTETRKVPK